MTEEKDTDATSEVRVRKAAEGDAAAPGRKRIPYPLVLLLLGALVVASATFGIAVGSISVPADQVWGILLHRVHPAPADPTWTPVRETIVIDVRLPRVLLAGVVGAGLAVCGMALQALVGVPGREGIGSGQAKTSFCAQGLAVSRAEEGSKRATEPACGHSPSPRAGWRG